MECDLVLHHVAQVHAIEQIVSGILARPRRVDSGNSDPARHGEKSTVVCGWHNSTRGEQRQVEKETAIEWNFDDFLVVDNIPERGRIRLHRGGKGFDGHHRSGLADLQTDIHAHTVLNGERDLTLLKGLKARLLNLDGICSWPDRCEFIVAG